MKKEEFFFTSRDGVTRIHAVKWLPEAEPVCILQIVHGMAEHIERYERLAGVLTARGILVTGEDHLGHGQSLGEKGKKGYFCAQDPATVLVRDVHRLKKTVQEQYPGIPYLILGHSMGSFILRNYLCRYGSGIDGAVIMGTGMQPKALLGFARGLTGLLGILQGQEHESRLLNALAFGTYNKRIAHPESVMDWLSADAGEVRKYLEDPLCGFCFTVNGFSALFELIHRLHRPDAVEKIPRELPVLFLAGDEDPVGDYGRAVRQVAAHYRDSGMKNVECRIYPGMRHELVNEREHETVEQDICAWVQKTAEQSRQTAER